VTITAGEALRAVGLDPAACEVEDTVHNALLTPALWRVTTADGCLALKVVTRERSQGDGAFQAHWTAGADEPRHWNHWPREALAYREGVTEAFASGGIHGPAVVATDIDDQRAILLIEWAAGTPPASWTLEDYGRVANALGQAQGALTYEDRPWLSRDYVRDYVAEKPADFALLDDHAAWDHPLVRATWPAELREASQWLHAHRDRLLAIMTALPRTLCHLDFWPSNLLAHHDGTFVLLDWAFVGDGAYGEDVGNLVPDAVLDHFVVAAEIAALQDVAFSGYIAGVARTRPDLDPDLIRLGLLASAVKYDWLVPLQLSRRDDVRHLRYGGLEEINAEERFHERGVALLHNARNAQAALALAEALGR
jgi:hypothetical protein